MKRGNKRRVLLYIIWSIVYSGIIGFIFLIIKPLIPNFNMGILNLSFLIIVGGLLVKDYFDIKGEKIPTKNLEHCPLSVLIFLLWYPGIWGGGVWAIIGILAAVDIVLDFTDDFKIIRWKRLFKT